MSRRKKGTELLIAKYAMSNFYKQALGLLTAFIRPWLLGPEYYGLWNLLKALPLYSSYADLGARSSMRYLIPRYAAQSDEARVKETQGSAFRVSFWGTLCWVVAVSLLALYRGFTTETRVSLLIIGLIILLFWYFDFHSHLLRSRQQFEEVARAKYVKATAVFVFTLVLTYYFSIYGTMIGLLLANAVSIYYFKRRGVLEKQPSGSLRSSINLVRHGLPIVLIDLATILLRTSDRFVIALLMGTEAVGYYGISSMILGSIMNIPGVSREIIEPRIMQSVKEKITQAEMQQYFVEPILNTAYLMPLMIGPLTLAIPLVIETLLPRYVEGVVPCQVLMVSSFFMTLSYPARGIFVVEGKQVFGAIIASPSLILNVVLSVAAIRAGYGITGVAVGTGLSFFFYMATMLGYIAVSQRGRPGSILRNLLLVAVPFVAMLSGLLLLNAWVPEVIGGRVMVFCIQVSGMFLLSLAVLLAARKFRVLRLEICPSALSLSMGKNKGFKA